MFCYCFLSFFAKAFFFLLFHLKLCKFQEITTDCTEITSHFSTALGFPRKTNWELFWAGYQITTVFRVPPKGSYIGSHNLSCICSVSDWASRLVPNDISVYPSRDPSLLSRYWLILSDDGKLAQLLSASLDPKGEVNMLRLMWHTLNMPENHKDFLGVLEGEQSCETKAYRSNRNSD